MRTESAKLEAVAHSVDGIFLALKAVLKLFYRNSVNSHIGPRFRASAVGTVSVCFHAI